MNATDLFLLPHVNFRNSESSWSRLFTFHILDASSRGTKLCIPTFVYREEGNRWYFEQQKEALQLPSKLDFKLIVVEGKLRTGFLPGISDPLPMKFNDLRLDITILGHSLVVIETKTVGARITQKEQLYFDLCEWLIERGINSKAYLLLSAGHQPDTDVHSLVGTEWKQVPSLILWEQFFKAIEKQVRNPLFSRLFPNLHQYYEPEEGYLSGNFA